MSLSGGRRFTAVRASRARASVGVIRVNLARNNLSVHRLGIALPRISRAVDRNRLRRRIRAVIRPLLEVPASTEGLDVVVTAGMPATGVPFASLEADLTHSLHNAWITGLGLSIAPPA